jgi:hypothetical protein
MGRAEPATAGFVLAKFIFKISLTMINKKRILNTMRKRHILLLKANY